MKEKITNYSLTFVKRFRVTILILISMVVLGAVSYTTLLQKEGFPNVDVPFVVLEVDYPVDNVSQVDRQVTRPLEVTIGDLLEVKEVSSFTTPNGANVIAELYEQYSSAEGREIIREEVLNSNEVDQSIPIEYQTFDASLIDGKYDIAVTISGDKSINELEAKAREVADDLIALPEVLNAEPINLLTTETNLTTEEEITFQERFNRVGIRDGDEIVFNNAINIGVQKRNGDTDSVTLSAAVRDRIDELVQEDSDIDLSEYEFTYGLDFAEEVRENISDLESNGLTGLIAVAVILLLFINWRASLVASIFIPTVMAGTFVVLYLIGYSLNVVSLFSLILVLGLFVDDAIVVVEAIDFQKQKGLKGIEAVRQAMLNIGVADVAGTLTTILVFAPMIFISGILGEFIRVIPITVVVALIVSLFTALTIIPFAADLIIRKITNRTLESIFSALYFFVALAIYLVLSNTDNGLQTFGIAVLVFFFALLIITIGQDLRKENRELSYNQKLVNALRFIILAPGQFINYIARVASVLVRVSFNGTRRSIISTIVIFVITIALIGGSLGIATSLNFSIFASPKDSEQIGGVINTRFDELYEPDQLNTLTREQRLKDTEKIAIEFEDLLLDRYGDEIIRYDYTFGLEDTAQFFVQLTPISDRDITSKEMIDDLEDDIELINGADIGLEVSAAGPPEDEFPFGMQIFANDQEVLEAAVADISGFLDRLELDSDQSVTEVRPDTLLALTKIEGRRFAEIRAQVSDEDDITNLVNNIQEQVEEEYDTDRLIALGLEEDALEFDFGQESENAESFDSTFVALGVALLLMYGLLVVQYNSFLQPALIFIAIPLSFPGLFPGLALTDNPLSFFVMIGIIGLTGIVVNNTIMLVDFANQAKEAGKNSVDAIAEAVRRRFRPVITTSATTIAGLLPLGLGDPFWEGLAFSIVFGILASALLIMFLFPAFYIFAEAIRMNVKRRVIFSVVMIAIIFLLGGMMSGGG